MKVQSQWQNWLEIKMSSSKGNFEYIHNEFAVTLIDKINLYVVSICQTFYAVVLIKELGVMT